MTTNLSCPHSLYFETKCFKNYEKIGSTYTYKGEVKGTNKEGNIENVKGQENTSKNEPQIKKTSFVTKTWVEAKAQDDNQARRHSFKR